MVKKGHGALVGITLVKGTSVDIFFQFCERKKWFLALVGLTYVKDASVPKKDAKKDRKVRVPSPPVWIHF